MGEKSEHGVKRIKSEANFLQIFEETARTPVLRRFTGGWRTKTA